MQSIYAEIKKIVRIIERVQTDNNLNHYTIKILK